MQTFKLKAKKDIPGLPDNKKIEKGESFTIKNIPDNSTTPFATKEAKVETLNQFKSFGYDFTDKKELFGSGHFSWEKI